MKTWTFVRVGDSWSIDRGGPPEARHRWESLSFLVLCVLGEIASIEFPDVEREALTRVILDRINEKFRLLPWRGGPDPALVEIRTTISEDEVRAVLLDVVVTGRTGIAIP